MIRPVFRKGKLIAFLGSVFHSVDIGGAPSVTARDSFEEGLTIPVSKILVKGVKNEDVIAFMTENLRAPEETFGDIGAQFSAYELGIQRLIKILDDEQIDDLDLLVEEILGRSETAMRKAISAVPDGTYSDEIMLDGFDEPLKICCEVCISGSELSVDFSGTSAQINRPVNSVLNYTVAYSAYAIKCAFDPYTPNNEGCFRPITINAPEGSLLNPQRPAPVWARHLTGHYLPPVIFSALAQLIPDRIIADCGSPVWNVYFSGKLDDGQRFIKMFFMNGGHGARSKSDGPGCLSFPSNVSNQSIEQFENQVPLIVKEKSFIKDTQGIGKHVGGPAQKLSFESTSNKPIIMSASKISSARVIGGQGGLSWV